jgi:DNA-binding GntR family transcriptional regulator
VSWVTRVAHGEAILVPVLAGLRHSEALGIDEGKPLLQITQVDYSTVGDVVMSSKEWHVPGVFELTLVRRPR